MLAVEAIGRSVPENGLYAAITSQAREIVIKVGPCVGFHSSIVSEIPTMSSLFFARRQVRIDTAESQ